MIEPWNPWLAILPLVIFIFLVGDVVAPIGSARQKLWGIDWCDRCRQLLHPVSCGLCGVGRWRLSCRCGGVDS